MIAVLIRGQCSVSSVDLCLCVHAGGKGVPCVFIACFSLLYCEHTCKISLAHSVSACCTTLTDMSNQFSVCMGVCMLNALNVFEFVCTHVH